jgi:hypothetical protein
MDAKKAAAPTWETVRYMISCIQYGGRITDDFDQLLMDTFAQKYFDAWVLQVCGWVWLCDWQLCDCKQLRVHMCVWAVCRELRAHVFRSPCA